jgi:hypothetical protein
MNRNVVLLSIVALALFVGAAYAYPGRGGGQPNGQGLNFIDEDNDGICDYAQNGQCNGYGKGFVDEDNDGVCDHAETGNGNRRGSDR